MWKTILPVCLCLAGFFSCNKEPMPENPVFLRIENETSQNFLQVLTSGESFDGVKAFSTTQYQTFMSILSAPSAELISSTDTTYAGTVATDYPTLIEDGKYTLEIVEDSTTHSGYNCMYKKD
jgi:hypothetical protein